MRVSMPNQAPVHIQERDTPKSAVDNAKSVGHPYTVGG